MSPAMTFIVYLLAALQVAAFAIAIVSRIWVLRPEPIVWRGIDVKFAAGNVQEYFIDIDDGRWAYPTGMFIPDETSDPDAGNVVMREDDFKGSRGLGWAMRIFQWGFVGAFAMLAGAARTGLIGFILGVFGAMFFLGFTALLALPFLFYSILDMCFRPLMRSRIEAEVKPHPDIADAVEIRLMFRGLSAFGLMEDAVTGLTAPQLPPGFTAEAIGVETSETEADAGVKSRAAAWVQDANRRFHVIFGSGIAGALVAAALLATFAPLDNANYHNYSDPTYASESTGDGTTSDGSSNNADESSGTDEMFTSDAFSVQPPADWTAVRDDVDRGGFQEWRWEPSDTDTMWMLIDHTAGFDGTPKEGAKPVRESLSAQSGYNEIDWRADGDDWYWEFELGGTRKIDRFISACGGGYALLYAAPEEDFDTYLSDFKTFVETFTPSCEGEGAEGDAEASAPSDGRIDHVSDQKFEASSTEGRMERAIRKHWQARLDGDYSAAYAMYSNPIRNRVGLESNWSDEIAKDGLNSVDIGGIKPVSVGSHGGQMVVRLTTDSDSQGCKNWRFLYTVNDDTGRWRISDAEATKSSC